MTRKEQAKTLAESFNHAGINALYGGKKGHGFWLQDRKTGQTIVDHKNRSGNEFFWLYKDAQNLLATL